MTKEVCKLPSFLSTAIFKRINVNETGVVTRDAFVDYWADFAMRYDLSVYMYLASHPGLEFLQNTPEFQERDAETVIYRIFYYVNRAGNGRLTLRELKRGNLIAAMLHADEEEDINKVLSVKMAKRKYAQQALQLPNRSVAHMVERSIACERHEVFMR
nr:hypothetical protein [Tanacetum cinerariifolium]